MTNEELMCKCTKLECTCKQLDEENEELRKRLDTAVKPIRRNTYQAAVDTYGKISQLIMATEEMSELIKELSKNYRGESNISHISEEMADVEIMLEQLKIIFKNRAEVDSIKADKLFRLSERILHG